MITVTRLKEVLHYDPFTGQFVWKIDRHKVAAGSTAGSIFVNKGGKSYLAITIDGKKYLAHRLAWLYMRKRFPESLTDHQDGDGLNNSWVNLRQVDPATNNQNMRMFANNSSGVTGVRWCKRRNSWQASLSVMSTEIYLGRFDCLIDAIAARKRAERLHNFHHNHGSVRPL